MTPPREIFAEAARKAIEAHSDWDSPHCFLTLHWDGEKLSPGTYACIMPDYDPADYPALMARIARERIEEHPDEPPAYAYLLQIEAFGLTEPGPAASPAEVERYKVARLTRTFHQHPDARESATAWCADVHGRLWNATKIRDAPGISERFYQPGRAPGGRLIRSLLSVAYATGMSEHGLPGPQCNLN